MQHLKKLFATTLLLTTGYVGTAMAHDLPDSSVGLAGSGAAKSDVYNVNCYDDGSGAAAKIFIQVTDLAPVKSAKVSIQAHKGTQTSALSTDAKDGDAVPSPGTLFAAGAGDYTVTVNKSAYTGTVAKQKGAELYYGTAHCETSSGVHTGTDISMTQNQ